MLRDNPICILKPIIPNCLMNMGGSEFLEATKLSEKQEKWYRYVFIGSYILLLLHSHTYACKMGRHIYNTSTSCKYMGIWNRVFSICCNNERPAFVYHNRLYRYYSMSLHWKFITALKMLRIIIEATYRFIYISKILYQQCKRVDNGSFDLKRQAFIKSLSKGIIILCCSSLSLE